jgi:hypothetical protein
LRHAAGGGTVLPGPTLLFVAGVHAMNRFGRGPGPWDIVCELRGGARTPLGVAIHQGHAAAADALRRFGAAS